MRIHWIAVALLEGDEHGAIAGSSFTGEDQTKFTPPDFMVIDGTLPDLLLTFAALTQAELRMTLTHPANPTFCRALHSLLILLSHYLEENGKDL